MSNLVEVCGSMQRAAVILNAVREVIAAGERPTPATVGALLPEVKYPSIGEIGEDEVAAAFEQLEAEADAHVASLTENEAPSSEDAGASQTEPRPALPHRAATDLSPPNHTDSQDSAGGAVNQMDRDAAVNHLRECHTALAHARANVLTCQNKRAAARARLSEAIGCWQSGLPRVTREQAARDVIATHQMTRAQRRAPPAPGPSYWDRAKFYSGQGDGNDFARRQHQNGGNMRGAYPKSAMGRIVRVPSER